MTAEEKETLNKLVTANKELSDKVAGLENALAYLVDKTATTASAFVAYVDAEQHRLHINNKICDNIVAMVHRTVLGEKEDEGDKEEDKPQ